MPLLTMLWKKLMLFILQLCGCITFMAVSLVLASIWCAFRSTQKVSFKLDVTVWASEAWTPC